MRKVCMLKFCHVVLIHTKTFHSHALMRELFFLPFKLKLNNYLFCNRKRGILMAPLIKEKIILFKPHCQRRSNTVHSSQDLATEYCDTKEKLAVGNN